MRHNTKTKQEIVDEASRFMEQLRIRSSQRIEQMQKINTTSDAKALIDEWFVLDHDRAIQMSLIGNTEDSPVSSVWLIAEQLGPLRYFWLLQQFIVGSINVKQFQRKYKQVHSAVCDGSKHPAKIVHLWTNKVVSLQKIYAEYPKDMFKSSTE